MEIDSNCTSGISGFEKGKRNEHLVMQAFSGIGNGRSFLFPNWLIRVTESKRYSPSDFNGADFFFFVSRGEIEESIPLQVKSSEHAAKKFTRIGRRIGKIIPVVVINESDTEETVRAKIIPIIHKEVEEIGIRKDYGKPRDKCGKRRKLKESRFFVNRH